MRVPRRWRTHHGRHDLANGLLGDVVSAPLLGTVGKPFHLPNLEPLADSAHLRHRKRQPRRDLHSGNPVSSHQNHAGSPDVPRRCGGLRHECLELPPLGGCDRERCGLSHASSYEATPFMVAPISRTIHKAPRLHRRLGAVPHTEPETCDLGFPTVRMDAALSRVLTGVVERRKPQARSRGSARSAGPGSTRWTRAQGWRILFVLR